MTGTGRILGTLSFVVFVRVLGVFLVLVGFVEHWARLGGSPGSVGVGFGAYALALALFLLPLGMLSDRIGPRKVMAGALVVSALGGLVAAFATEAWLFAVGRFVQGMGAVNGVALAVAGEIGEPSMRTRRMAALGAAAGAGVVGGLILSALFHRVGVTIPQILVGFSLLTFLTVPLVASVMPRAVPHADAPRGPPAWRLALLLGAGAFAVNLSLSALLLFSRDLIAAATDGIAYEIALLVMLLPAGLGMYLAARMADRGHARLVATGAALLLAVAPLAFLGPNGTLVVLVAGILFFIGHSSMTSLLPSLAARLAPGGRRGLAQGVQSTLQYLGSFVGTALMGVLHVGGMVGATVAMFLVAGAVAGGVVLVALRA